MSGNESLGLGPLATMYIKIPVAIRSRTIDNPAAPLGSPPEAPIPIPIKIPTINDTPTGRRAYHFHPLRHAKKVRRISAISNISDFLKCL